MYIYHNAFDIYHPDHTASATTASMDADAVMPWDLETTPSHKWALLADAAIRRGDTKEAKEMTEFAYWAADAAR
jgi:hypothetical protein